MASENYVLLERTELNASAASVTFANIPQTGYTDLKIVSSARTDRASVVDDIAISFNGSTASFSGRELYGDGASAVSITTSRAASVAAGANATASTFGNSEIYIPNYTGSAYKSFSVDGVQETNATTAYAVFIAGLWSNTAAITSVGLSPLTGPNFVSGSTFSLYGLAALGTTPAIAPKASGGNIIATDGTYWIHTFTSSGTFTPQTGLTCDYLVVAGGGGGGYGGAGAGGFRTATGFSVTAQNYAITVGAGGAGRASGGVLQGSNGSDSVFSTITSSGGGGGGGAFTSVRDGKNGGSGGGAGYDNSFGGTVAGGAGNTPSTSPSQGNNGGTGTGTTETQGGGGGAGAVGGNGDGTNSGPGGAGTANSYSGSSVTYAGGGGGAGGFSKGAGAGGSGGGGAGSVTGNGTSGTINTGGGGGGGNFAATPNLGGTGGSGIVIIRYTAA